jgi:hypothetical protein
MIMRQAQYDARRKRRDDDDDDDDPEIGDGSGVRVKMAMMDAAKPVRWVHCLTDAQAQAITDAHARAHQPHFLVSTSREVLDAQAKARDARAQKIASASQAWRPPNTYIAPTTTVGDARAAAVQSRLDRIQRMKDAWRNPPSVSAPAPRLRDAAVSEDIGRRYPPNTSAGPGSKNPDYDREAAYRARVTALENAWRNPGAAATTNEYQRRNWTYENAPHRPRPGGQG